MFDTFWDYGTERRHLNNSVSNRYEIVIMVQILDQLNMFGLILDVHHKTITLHETSARQCP